MSAGEAPAGADHGLRRGRRIAADARVPEPARVGKRGRGSSIDMPKKAAGAAGAKGRKEKAGKPQEDDGTDINLAEGRISIVGTQPDKVDKVLKKHAGAAARIFELDLTDNNLK